LRFTGRRENSAEAKCTVPNPTLIVIWTFGNDITRQLLSAEPNSISAEIQRPLFRSWRMSLSCRVTNWRMRRQKAKTELGKHVGIVPQVVGKEGTLRR